ncbi:MAG: SIR2 family protein, partial [Rhodoplanes sp.]
MISSGHNQCVSATMLGVSVLPHALRSLARLFDEPKPHVLMVVGTGISIGATDDPRASWKGLLLDAVSRIESLGIAKRELLAANRTLIEDAFTGEFKLAEILQRAESIIEHLGGVDDSHFANWLKDSVGALKAKPDQRESLDAIADLAKAGALILTTNYDSLLSEATGFDSVTWEEPDKILEVVNRKRRGIIHIHGHWGRPSSVVLGRTSYDRIKSAALPQTELKSLWLVWHWLYLGCG